MDILKNRSGTHRCVRAHTRGAKPHQIIKTTNMKQTKSFNDLRCSTLNQWVNEMNITNIELSRLTRYLFSEAFEIDFENLSEIIESESEANEKYRLLIERVIIGKQ